MAPPNPPPAEPSTPPKREPSPVLIPTVGLGKDQVLDFIFYFILILSRINNMSSSMMLSPAC